jgi:hypothetical protein
MGLRGRGWAGLDQPRALVNTMINLRVPENVGQFLRSLGTGSLSRRAEVVLAEEVRTELLLASCAVRTAYLAEVADFSRNALERGVGLYCHA